MPKVAAKNPAAARFATIPRADSFGQLAQTVLIVARQGNTISLGRALDHDTFACTGWEP